MTWTQFGKLAEFSDDPNDFALTAEDVLNVKTRPLMLAIWGLLLRLPAGRVRWWTR